MLAAAFIRCYGMDAYRHDAYPTRDRIIPYRRFYALLGAMRAVHAAEQYRSYHATALGVANAMAGSEEAKEHVNAAVERLRALAFPTVP